MGTINNKLETLKNTKENIRLAINEKGQNVSTSDPFSAYPDKIKKIETGINTDDATAVSADILSGKTAYVKNSKINGTMPNQGNWGTSLNAGGSVIIPAGYHNGSGRVNGNSLANQTSGTATANDIKSGKTAWVNGSRITGNYNAPIINTKNINISNNTSDTIWISYQSTNMNDFDTTYLNAYESDSIRCRIGGWVYCFPQNMQSNPYSISGGSNLGPGGAINGNTVQISDSTYNLSISYY